MKLSAFTDAKKIDLAVEPGAKDDVIATMVRLLSRSRHVADGEAFLRDVLARESLVTTGVFAISRNPIYVALDLIAVSIVLMSGSFYFLLTGLLVMAGINVQIHREEHFLADAFGESLEGTLGAAGALANLGDGLDGGAHGP